MEVSCLREARSPPVLDMRSKNVSQTPTYRCDDRAPRISKEAFQLPTSFPQFDVPAENVEVLYTPDQFRQWLCGAYAKANRRIGLAALYIGSADPEREVITAIETACKRHVSSSTNQLPHGNFQVSVVIDSARGQRKEGQKGLSSVAILHDLLRMKQRVDQRHNDLCGSNFKENGFRVSGLTQEDKAESNGIFSFESTANTASTATSSGGSEAEGSDHDSSEVDDGRVQVDRCLQAETVGEWHSLRGGPITSGYLDVAVGLFHSPLLTGLLYKLLPPRVNEILGVFHTKFFIADDSVLLTGANLSESYLTNRQDRYVVIHNCPEFANFLFALMELLQAFSFDAELLPETEAQKETMAPLQSRNLWRRLIGDPADSRKQIVSVPGGGKVALRLLSEHVPSPVTDALEFCKVFGAELRRFLRKHSTQSQKCGPDPAGLGPVSSVSSLERKAHKAHLSVAMQAGFCEPAIQQEEKLLQAYLMAGSSKDFSSEGSKPPFPKRALEHVVLASGYLNMTDELLGSLTSVEPIQSEEGKSFSAELALSSGSNQDKPSTQHQQCKLVDTDIVIDSDLEGNATAQSTDTGIRARGLEVFMAAPEANSFHRSKGLSKYIPMAYSYVGARQLLNLRYQQRRQCYIARSTRPARQMSEETAKSQSLVVAALNVVSRFVNYLQAIVVGLFVTGDPNRRGLWGGSDTKQSTSGAIALDRIHTDSQNSSKADGSEPRMSFRTLFRRRRDHLAGSGGWIKENYFFSGADTGAALIPKMRDRWMRGTGSYDSRGGPAPIFREYGRPGWTFHSKGVWLYGKEEGNDRNTLKVQGEKNAEPARPFATVIGSSNFGLRSRVRDFDLSFLIETDDKELQLKFGQEVEIMRAYATQIRDVTTLLRRCPSWLRFLLRFTRFKTLL